MQTRIFKIAKEILIIVTIVFISNLILNNKYVRPQINFQANSQELKSTGSENNKDWHIYKREHKLLLGISGHTFIELRDSDNNIISQLHGKAYDASTGELVEVARSFLKTYTLKVIEYSGDRYKEKNINIGNVGIEIAKGEQSSIMSSWDKAKSCGEKINSENINYPKFGFKIISETENSNSVAHTLIECMGYTDRDIGIFTPGEHSELIKF